jgi:branched-chain amino acid transport system permease protein
MWSVIFTNLLALGCINGIMVVALNLQYGYTGLLNFAFYIYVAVGAYVAGVTTMGPSSDPQAITYVLGWSVPWYVGLLLGGCAATLLGAVIFSFTVRRLRSDYLGIVTVATAYIIWNFINNFIPLFDGAQGIFNVPYITGNAPLSSVQYSLLVGGIALAILGVFVLVSRLIFRSPYGRVLRSIREDPVVVEAFGRKAWKPQLWIFLMGSFMGGIAGGLFIFYITAWSPNAFMPLESFALMGALVIGGSGNYWGAVFGAFLVLEGLNELTRYVPTLGITAFGGAVRLFSIGLGMILVLRFRPEGLMPERWLHWYRERSAATGSVTSDGVVR